MNSTQLASLHVYSISSRYCRLRTWLAMPRGAWQALRLRKTLSSMSRMWTHTHTVAIHLVPATSPCSDKLWEMRPLN